MSEQGVRAVESMEKNGEFIGRIMYRPKLNILVVGAVIALLFLTGNRYGIILGILLAVIVLGGLLIAKDHPVMDVYTDQLIFYAPDNSAYGVSVPVSDVVEWNVNKTVMYTIYIRLKDGRQYTEECYYSRQAYNYLRKVLPAKDTTTLQRRFFASLLSRRKGK
ncbi:MAG: hypothetical protein K6F23_10180 [Solobacterium sp.]|nr:hypothetical protein [Solobacterium sp.]